jgi:uncharacterized membrane protein (Fun14 family)
MMERMNGYIPESSKGFFAGIWSKLRLSQDVLVQCGVVAGVAFLLGFLLKKFSAYIAMIVALGVLFVFLSHFGIINVVFDWSKAQSFTGVDLSDLSSGNCIEKLWAIVRMNIAASIAGVIGFMIGLRLG